MRIRDWSSDVCSSDRGAIEIGGGGAGVAVIGRGRATDLAEIGAAVLVRAQIARTARHILARQLAQPIDIGVEALEIGNERGIGAVGGDDAATLAAAADSAARVERVELVSSGRAVRRERWWQLVYTPGDGVCVQEKT